MSECQSSRTGMGAELLVAYVLLSQGRDVVIPNGNRAGYDLLVWHGNAWAQAQVKCARVKRKTPVVDIRRDHNSKKRKYESGDFSILFVVDLARERVWEIDASKIREKQAISVTNGKLIYDGNRKGGVDSQNNTITRTKQMGINSEKGQLLQSKKTRQCKVMDMETR